MRSLTCVSLAVGFFIVSLSFATADDWGTVRGKLDLSSRKSSVGSSNALILLRPIGNSEFSIHPKYRARTPKTLELTISDGLISPAIAVASTTEEIRVRNSDSTGYNLSFATIANPPQNLVLHADSSKPIRIERPEPTAVSVSCNIHPKTQGWLMMIDHPYFVFADQDGSFELKLVPIGKFQLEIYHGKRITKRKLDVVSGILDLGTVSRAVDVGRTNR